MRSWAFRALLGVIKKSHEARNNECADSCEYCNRPSRWAGRKVASAAEYFFSQQPNRPSRADIAGCKNSHQITATFKKLTPGLL